MNFQPCLAWVGWINLKMFRFHLCLVFNPFYLTPMFVLLNFIIFHLPQGRRYWFTFGRNFIVASNPIVAIVCPKMHFIRFSCDKEPHSIWAIQPSVIWHIAKTIGQRYDSKTNNSQRTDAEVECTQHKYYTTFKSWVSKKLCDGPLS